MSEEEGVSILSVKLLYPIFKILLGGTCFVLSVEYLIAYLGYSNYLYLGDMLTWFGAFIVLFVEGWRDFFRGIKKSVG